MKKLLIITLLVLMTGLIFGEKIGPLPDVLKPTYLTVSQGKLYVFEACELSIYSLKDMKLITKFGKKGEGPQEFKFSQMLVNTVAVGKDSLVISSYDKLSLFSKDGKFIKEMKKQPRIQFVHPVGKNFVAQKLFADSSKKIRELGFSIILLDKDLKELKVLYSQPHIQQGSGNDMRLAMQFDYVNFSVCNDKIYIESSPDGFVINVFDSDGNTLEQIKQDYEKIPTSDEYKKDIVERFQKDPRIKQQIDAAGGWTNFKTKLTLNYPATLPAIRNFAAMKNNFAVRTYKMVGVKDEYLITDLKGKVLKRTLLPAVDRDVPLLSELFGVKLYSFSDGVFYCLIEDEDEEVYELHGLKLK
ncbi:MAG: hypothetical protein GY765_30010 [bacterium]|nr:hypothetical protein [bacterium]